MKDSLFRKESLERISSPEQLHDYMRVTSPRLWMVLAAILLLLIGFIVYASTAQLENTIALDVEVSYGFISGDISPDLLDVVKIHMPVRIAGVEGAISDINQYSAVCLDLDTRGQALEDGYYSLAFADEATFDETSAPSVYVLNGKANSYDYTGALRRGVSEPREVYLYDRFTSIASDGEDGTDEPVRHGPYTLSGVTIQDSVTLMIQMNDPNAVLKDGTYHAEIITESTTPISFLLN